VRPKDYLENSALNEIRRPMGFNGGATRQNLAGVLPDDDTIAEQSPALTRMCSSRFGRLAARSVWWWTLRVMRAHMLGRTLGH
jgi:hypothetical protein